LTAAGSYFFSSMTARRMLESLRAAIRRCSRSDHSLIEPVPSRVPPLLLGAMELFPPQSSPLTEVNRFSKRNRMRILLLILLFGSTALAQGLSSSLIGPCGSGSANFKVKLGDGQHVPAQPAPGKALVYFIHDAGTSAVFAYPTTKLAVDGAWVGANHSNSYFSVSVDPGEHHVCATLQSSLVENRAEFAHFQAEAGKVYYYRTRLVMSRAVEMLDLDPIDSDEGQYLIQSYPLSIFRQTK
jgi:hypothetical protein